MVTISARLYKCLLVLALLLACTPVVADSGKDQTVLVLLSKASKPYFSFASHYRKQLQNSIPGIRVRIETPGTLVAGSLDGSELVVSVGVNAMKYSSLHLSRFRTLYTLLPERVYRVVLAEKKLASRHAVLFIDQPLQRVFRLSRLVFGKNARIGAVFGVRSAGSWKYYSRAATSMNQVLVSRLLRQGEEVMPVFLRIYRNVQAVLLVPDKQVVNSRTVRSILVSSYHNNIPLIGYSSGYVKAGALMAVYSTPVQLARHSAEMTAVLLSGRKSFGWHAYPAYYSVKVNRKVADSLNLKVPPESTLLIRLLKEEKR